MLKLNKLNGNYFLLLNFFTTCKFFLNKWNKKSHVHPIKNGFIIFFLHNILILIKLVKLKTKLESILKVQCWLNVVKNRKILILKSKLSQIFKFIWDYTPKFQKNISILFWGKKFLTKISILINRNWTESRFTIKCDGFLSITYI